MIDKPTTKEIARFFDKVRITKHCWLWTAGLSWNGYGQLGFHGRTTRAHHFSYKLFVGSIEPGKLILHRRECGNRNCVNPNHLYMGTHIDNTRDMILWGDHQYGETHPLAKLSEKDVLEIRRLHRNKRQKRKYIANLFRISLSHLDRIISGQAWKHLHIGDTTLCFICHKELAEVSGFCISCDHLMDDIRLDRQVGLK